MIKLDVTFTKTSREWIYKNSSEGREFTLHVSDSGLNPASHIITPHNTSPRVTSKHKSSNNLSTTTHTKTEK